MKQQSAKNTTTTLCIALSIIFLLIPFQPLSAQTLFDDFSYASFPNDTTWKGDTGLFAIDNQRLRSDFEQTNSSFYLAANHQVGLQNEWRLKLELQFNTSSANYVDFVMASNDSNLLTATDYYYVRIGNTKDEVCLYKVINNGTPQLLIDGRDNILNRSNNPLFVKITYDESHKWSLWVNDSGNEKPLFFEGEVVDTLTLDSRYTGILISQSTASFVKKHFFDYIYAGPPILDTIPPFVTSFELTGNNQISLLFSEEIDTLGLSQKTPFILTPSSGQLQWQSDSTLKQFNLQFPQNFVSRTDYKLQLSEIPDLSGNKIQDTLIHFRYLVPEKPIYADLLINEIMATPSPAVGLPEHRFVELYNRSDKVIDLNGLILRDRTSGVALPSFLLEPDSFIVLCRNAAVADLSPFAKVLGLSTIPSFNKTSDDIYLYDADSSLLFYLGYTDEWYGDVFKKQGGFSLEMKDSDNPCGGMENWAGSTSNLGGTPGKKNSVKSKVPDNKAPELLSVYPLSADLIEIRFNEWLDSSTSMNLNNYLILPVGIHPEKIQNVSFSKIILRLPFPLNEEERYTLEINSAADCAGNTMKSVKTEFGFPSKVERGDVIVNEILFNPPTGLSEFVEILNVSDKILDVKDIYLGNLSDSGTLRDFVQPVPEGLLMFPGQYLCFSVSGNALCDHYFCKAPQNILKVSKLPSYPQRSGGVILLNKLGKTLDSMIYKDDMHFKLIADKKGVSLERIDPYRKSTDKGNWNSATTTVGFATPGYVNSQHRIPTQNTADIYLDPKVFSPDGDGFDDLLNIHYKLPEPNYMANIYVFDANGRLMAHPLKSVTLEQSGILTWDGFIDNSQVRAPFGIYVILFEAFHPNGQTVKKKMSATLVGRY